MPRDVERVAVVLELLAQKVWLVVAAVPAPATGHVCGRNDPIAGPEQLAVGGTDFSSRRLDDADVLVPADEWIADLPLVRRPGVLDRLAAERVLVRAADP